MQLFKFCYTNVGMIDTKVKSQGSNNSQNVREEPASFIGRSYFK